jgi:hypothetical protein
MLVPPTGDGTGKQSTTHGGNQMRHRDESGAAKSVVSGMSETLSKLTDLLSEEQESRGKHKLPTRQPLIPTQKMPIHETVEDAPVDAADVVDAVDIGVEVTDAPEGDELTDAPEGDEGPVEVRQDAAILSPAALPTSVQWKASHAPRVFAAAMLLFAVAGTSALGLRYAETRESDELISLFIGVGVIVALWALLIASTPQVVSLRGSVLTVRNSSGSERFDLADGLQPVDVVGEPRSSQWALLLHRSNNTSVVLRRRDVDAVALDPIVRHYRALADKRYTDRQVRFSR